MKLSPLKTKIVGEKDSLFSLIDPYLSKIGERSILAVTSKITALCEGRVYDSSQISKSDLIKQEADQYINIDSEYPLTIKNGILIPAAGIDESNTNGKLVGWPKKPFESARKIRDYIARKNSLTDFGVIITDSRTSPLRWGTTGISIAYAGFHALKDYRDREDLFGRKLKVTLANYADALASAAVLVMGEGSEQTPMALIDDLPFVEFDQKSPTAEEIDQLSINIDDDLYSSILKSVDWKKGGSGLKQI